MEILASETLYPTFLAVKNFSSSIQGVSVSLSSMASSLDSESKRIASTFDQGNNLIPGFSLKVRGIHMINNNRANCATMTPKIPITPIITPNPAPPIIIPSLFAANMNPFTLATSSG